jgi:hypothetical protein
MLAPQLASPGRPLDGSTAARMGAAYGHSFSHVRIHDGGGALSSVTSEPAIAATVGADVAFAPGYYRPGTAMGDALIAHELAHVEQQRTGGDVPGAAHEADAHEATVGAVAHLAGVRGEPRARPSRGSAIAPQRCGGMPNWAPQMPAGTLTPSNQKAFVEGAKVDAMLMNSPTLGKYITPRSKAPLSNSEGPIPPRGTSAEHIRYHPQKEWEQVMLAEHAGKPNPRASRCDRSFTPEEVRALAPNVRGFWSPGADLIHINEDTADETTPIHESIHRYLHPRYLDTVGMEIVEGTTEYFANIVRGEQEPKLVPKQDAYPEETYSVGLMANKVGVDAMAEAYFNGNIEVLRAANDKLVPGRFDAWCKATRRGDLEAANTLFGMSRMNRTRLEPVVFPPAAPPKP